jgi:LysM repeat protein
LNRLLTEEMRAGRRFVLVIDEAQNLDEKVLESVRLLSNFETPWMKLMQIVLAGQPQLADRLASPSMAQLRQRVSMIIRIDPFTNQDVNAYIDHRLWVAGCEKPTMFTVGARKLIAEHSEGIPRNINNLCFNAMSLACALKRKTIDRDIVQDVIADLDLEPLREKTVVAPKSEKKPERPAPSLTLAAKRQSVGGGWIPKLAITSILALTAAAFILNLDHSAPRASVSPARVANVSDVAPQPPAPIVVSEVSLMQPDAAKPKAEPAAEPPTEPKTEPKTEQVSEDVRVKPGQTLYQISVEKLGKYNGKVLEELQNLNPGLSDPDRIHPGQKIRVPAAKANSTETQRAAQQAPNAAPAEVGKQ